MFDSTHFPDGETVRITIWAKEADGNEQEESIEATVYNKYALYELTEFTDDSNLTAIDLVKDTLDAHNYSSAAYEKGPGFLWSGEGGAPGSVQTGLSQGTFFYENSHGYSGTYPNQNGLPYCNFQTSGGELVFANDQMFGGTSTEVFTPTKNAVGLGGNLPPFNGGRPPTTIAFLDSCQSDAVAGAFAWSLLYPMCNDYTFIGWIFYNTTPFGETENQVFFGWSENCYANGTHARVESIMEVLDAGGTAAEAGQVIYPSYFHVVGDSETRLTTVYGGDGSSWYRFES